MKTNRIIVLGLTLLMLLSGFGCSSRKSDAPEVSSSYYGGYSNDVNYYEGEYDKDGVLYSYKVYEDSADYVSAPKGNQRSNDQSLKKVEGDEIDRKVIRNATLNVNSKDAKNFYSKVTTYNSGLGGLEYSYSMSVYDSYTVITATLKVPPEQLGNLIQYIEANGEVINSSMNSDDITEGYYDTKTRLESKRKSLEQYYTLLKNAKTIDEIIQIQKIIDGITEDIEAMEGRLKVWDFQTDMATVQIYVRQDNDPIIERKEINWNALSWEDMGYLIKKGFLSVANTVISIVQWFVIVVIGYSLLFIALATATYFGIKTVKKNRAKRRELIEKKKAAVQENQLENGGKVNKISKE